MAETSADTCHSLLLLGLHILIGSVLDPCPQKGTLSSHTHTHTGYSSMVYSHEDSASSSLGGEALLCLECGVGEGSKGKGTCAKVVELKTKGTISFYVTVKQTSWKTRRDDA